MNYIPINRSGEAIEFGIDTKDVINITEKRYVNESGDSINNLVIKENCKINQDLIVKGKIHVSNDLYANNNLNVNKDLNINGNINCENFNKKNKSQDDEISKIIIRANAIEKEIMKIDEDYKNLINKLDLNFDRLRKRITDLETTLKKVTDFWNKININNTYLSSISKDVDDFKKVLYGD